MADVIMQVAMVLIAAGRIPAGDVITSEVDLIEVNHFIGDQGELVLEQVIFYYWSDLDCRYNVQAWQMLKSQSQIPRRHWGRRDFEATWYDRGRVRQVRCKSVYETWTQYDPELLDRKFLQQAARPGLPR